MSQYLAAKTNTLESQAPVPPSQARTAQVPLSSFNLPTFPPEAFSAGLTSLILTADIKTDEYTALLQQPFSIPDLPNTITSLTLELFSLGYPAGFLTVLGEKLPGLTSLTLYSQLLAGITPDTLQDALLFVRGQTSLRELHLLDVFSPPGFLTALSSALSPSLRFLEVNFAFRHSDPGFFGGLNTGEVVRLVEDRKGLLGLTACISAPEGGEDDAEDIEGTEVGIKVASGKGVVEIFKAGEGADLGAELRMCDITMFELTVKDVEKVLQSCKNVKVLGVSVGLDAWEDVFADLPKTDTIVEVLEIVGVPGEAFVERMKSGKEAGVQQDLLERIGQKWKELKNVKLSILRTNEEEWVREGGAWQQKT